MRVLYVVDAQSPIASSWIGIMCSYGVEAHLITSYSIPPGSLPVATQSYIPWDMTATIRNRERQALSLLGNQAPSALRSMRGSRIWNASRWIRDRFAPLLAIRNSKAVANVVERIQPDLVHAMRLPYEGYMTALALAGKPFPLLISTWGNDFTLNASYGRLERRLTEQAMQRANGLHPDCSRDLRLAITFGFRKELPFSVLPGNGGIDSVAFRQGAKDFDLMKRLGIPLDAKVVVNVRGVSPRIRNDTFFELIPQVLSQIPDAWFVGVKMANRTAMVARANRLGGDARISLTEPLTSAEVGALFRSSSVNLSLAEHDGTPNSLLESMACGTVPVAGDIESIREWITNGVNGFLVDPGNPIQAASAVIRAIQDQSFRSNCIASNLEITNQLSKEVVAGKAFELYDNVIRHRLQTAVAQ